MLHTSIGSAAVGSALDSLGHALTSMRSDVTAAVEELHASRIQLASERHAAEQAHAHADYLSREMRSLDEHEKSVHTKTSEVLSAAACASARSDPLAMMMRLGACGLAPLTHECIGSRSRRRGHAQEERSQLEAKATNALGRLRAATGARACRHP